MFIEPSLVLLQLASSGVLTTTIGAGDCTLSARWLVQPFASVTVNEYCPLHNGLATIVVPINEDHEKAYGKVPPDGIAVMLPSQLPIHFSFIVFEIPKINWAGSVIVMDDEFLHPV